MKKFCRGFVDPLSVIVIGFFLVTVYFGVKTVKDTQNNQNINEKAASCTCRYYNCNAGETASGTCSGGSGLLNCCPAPATPTPPSSSCSGQCRTGGCGDYGMCSASGDCGGGLFCCKACQSPVSNSTPTPGPSNVCQKLYYCNISTYSCVLTSSQYDTGSHIQCDGSTTCEVNLAGNLPGGTTGACFSSQSDCLVNCARPTPMPTPCYNGDCLHDCTICDKQVTSYCGTKCTVPATATPSPTPCYNGDCLHDCITCDGQVASYCGSKCTVPATSTPTSTPTLSPKPTPIPTPKPDGATCSKTSYFSNPDSSCQSGKCINTGSGTTFVCAVNGIEAGLWGEINKMLKNYFQQIVNDPSLVNPSTDNLYPYYNAFATGALVSGSYLLTQNPSVAQYIPAITTAANVTAIIPCLIYGPNSEQCQYAAMATYAGYNVVIQQQAARSLGVQRYLTNLQNETDAKIASSIHYVPPSQAQSAANYFVQNGGYNNPDFKYSSGDNVIADRVEINGETYIIKQTIYQSDAAGYIDLVRAADSRLAQQGIANNMAPTTFVDINGESFAVQKFIPGDTYLSLYDTTPRGQEAINLLKSNDLWISDPRRNIIFSENGPVVIDTEGVSTLESLAKAADIAGTYAQSNVDFWLKP